MRRVGYLKAAGVALGLISGAQSPSLASTYTHPNTGGQGEAWRDGDYLVRVPTNKLETTSIFEGKAHEVSIDTAIASSLLNSSPYTPHQDQAELGLGLLSEIRFHSGDGSSHASATPLPAAFPLFAGGLGVLGLLARRRKRKAARSAQA